MKTIGASKIAALIDHSPYVTRWQLWQWAANDIPLPSPTHARAAEGVLLEPFILQTAADERGWELRPNSERCFRSDDETRISATPDGFIRSTEKSGTGVVDAKLVNVFRFWDSWGREEPSVPLHIELQIQWQMEITGCDWGAIVVYVMGGDETHVFYRDRDDEVIETLDDAAKEFWSSVDEMREPDPFGEPKEIPTLAIRYPSVLQTETVDLGVEDETAEAMARFKHAREQETFWKKQKESQKAVLLGVAAENQSTVCSSLDGRRFNLTVKKTATAAGIYERKAGVRQSISVKELARVNIDDTETKEYEI
jgi:predicted phage-related endonuclease